MVESFVVMTNQSRGELRVNMLWTCLPLKKRIFDPLLPKRLAEFGIELNTPCVPCRHGGGYYIYVYIYMYIYIYILYISATVPSGTQGVFNPMSNSASL